MFEDNLKEYKKESFDRMLKDKLNKEKSERQLSYLVLGIIGISLYFNTLVPISAIFLIFYYYANKNKITKMNQ